ncbi:cyclin-dependent kinase inhibitor 1 [Lampris incognitus]|uniref:cyclin-dependent kinase inhibitor 1 n=1 Tax=Lampris incognitus TaxID=2546036 RepID=UPI0024B60A35|nr:cyclin-dependent kinase inhibitor 1 [Lampris incognitus]XP_056130752.1 cyclin-dependent kinase inhibitor 1 [Lampris incognitus]
MMTTPKRILSVISNGPARRNLFGPVDREQLQVEYQAALSKDLEDASLRWGFDFFAEKPLEGSGFHWEDVPGTKVPFLYRSCMLGLDHHVAGRDSVGTRGTNPSRGRGELSRSEKENIPRSPERCSVKQQQLERMPEKGESAKLKRKQTNITDFYQAKRRVVGTPRKSGQ